MLFDYLHSNELVLHERLFFSFRTTFIFSFDIKVNRLKFNQDKNFELLTR